MEHAFHGIHGNGWEWPSHLPTVREFPRNHERWWSGIMMVPDHHRVIDGEYRYRECGSSERQANGERLRITLITVGKVKERYLRDAIEEYSKRLGRYCKLDIVEVADEKTPEHASEGMERQIKAKEGERIAKHIRDDAYVIALAIEGMQLTSEQLAAKINDLGLHGTSHIQLIIGGSLGLDPAILKRADYLLSFSKMTFPHQLMRVILLEQIYRAYKINAGEPYHK